MKKILLLSSSFLLFFIIFCSLNSEKSPLTESETILFEKVDSVISELLNSEGIRINNAVELASDGGAIALYQRTGTERHAAYDAAINVILSLNTHTNVSEFTTLMNKAEIEYHIRALEGNSENQDLLVELKEQLQLLSIDSKNQKEENLLVKKTDSGLVVNLAFSDFLEKSFEKGIEYKLSSKFGKRYHPVHKNVFGGDTLIHHSGIDISCDQGTGAVAPISGKVIKAELDGGYGNAVFIQNQTFPVEVRLAHLSTIDIKKGDNVSIGQPIGKTGKTGVVTRPSIHFEIRYNGKAHDPLVVLNQKNLRRGDVFSVQQKNSLYFKAKQVGSQSLYVILL